MSTYAFWSYDLLRPTGEGEAMRVEVYWNIRRKLFSVRALEGPDKGRVIAHRARVDLGDATFHVSKAGQARVRREGRKNVHAVIRGTDGAKPPSDVYMIGEVRYNPYRDPWFMRGVLEIHASQYVRCEAHSGKPCVMAETPGLGRTRR